MWQGMAEGAVLTAIAQSALSQAPTVCLMGDTKHGDEGMRDKRMLGQLLWYRFVL